MLLVDERLFLRRARLMEVMCGHRALREGNRNHDVASDDCCCCCAVLAWPSDGSVAVDDATDDGPRSTGRDESLLRLGLNDITAGVCKLLRFPLDIFRNRSWRRQNNNNNNQQQQQHQQHGNGAFSCNGMGIAKRPKQGAAGAAPPLPL